MIPRIIHYCWFGRGPLPETALRCIESWHLHMPDYEYRLWNEDNFDVGSHPYTKEAYEAGKYAFVSDYVRLYALKTIGGIYLDVDFIVYRPFDDLLPLQAFAGFEGSKYNPLMMGVIASEKNGLWITEQLSHYTGRHFVLNGNPDLTTNVQFVSRIMHDNGFRQDGIEQDYLDLHIFPVEYFCPKLTTGEYRRGENTYCESVGRSSSWASLSWRDYILRIFPPKLRTRLILIKRKLIG